MTPPKKLRAEQARELAEADAQCAHLKRSLEEATKRRAELRARLRDRFDLGAPVQAGGYEIVVKKVRTGASFKIGAFLEKHTLTKAMAPFFKEGGEREDWRIQQLPQKA